MILKMRAVLYDRGMLATACSHARLSMRSPSAAIDVHLTAGLPSLTVVGLAEATVTEANDSVRSAVTSCGSHWSLARVIIARTAWQPGKS
jgi:magnesium chelatase family protein